MVRQDNATPALSVSLLQRVVLLLVNPHQQQHHPHRQLPREIQRKDEEEDERGQEGQEERPLDHEDKLS